MDDPMNPPLHSLTWKIMLGIRGTTKIIRLIWSSVPAIEIEDSGLYRSARCTIPVTDSATSSMGTHSWSLDTEPIAEFEVTDSGRIEDSRKRVRK